MNEAVGTTLLINFYSRTQLLKSIETHVCRLNLKIHVPYN